MELFKQIVIILIFHTTLKNVKTLARNLNTNNNILVAYEDFDQQDSTIRDKRFTDVMLLVHLYYDDSSSYEDSSSDEDSSSEQDSRSEEYNFPSARSGHPVTQLTLCINETSEAVTESPTPEHTQEISLKATKPILNAETINTELAESDAKFTETTTIANLKDSNEVATEIGVEADTAAATTQAPEEDEATTKAFTTTITAAVSTQAPEGDETTTEAIITSIPA